MKISAEHLIVLTFLTTISASYDERIDEAAPERIVNMLHKDRPESRRVLGGSPVPKTGYSFAVSLLNKQKNSFCSGSIIAPTFVLTAAHCKEMHYIHKAINDNDSKYVKVYLVIADAPHPSYMIKYEGSGVSEIANDIGLLQTDTSMVGGWVQAIGLSSMTFKDLEHKVATVMGFGMRGLFAGPDFTILHYTNLELRKCKGKYTVTICGRTPSDVSGTKSICGGDSGGPLIYEGQLIGVNSMGQSPCAFFLPRSATSYFTFVPFYKSWIEAEMRSLSAKEPRPKPPYTTPQPKPSISGPKDSLNVKSIENSLNNDMDFQEKVITQDVYYINGDEKKIFSYCLIYLVILSILYIHFL